MKYPYKKANQSTLDFSSKILSIYGLKVSKVPSVTFSGKDLFFLFIKKLKFRSTMLECDKKLNSGKNSQC